MSSARLPRIALIHTATEQADVETRLHTAQAGGIPSSSMMPRGIHSWRILRPSFRPFEHLYPLHGAADHRTCATLHSPPHRRTPLLLVVRAGDGRSLFCWAFRYLLSRTNPLNDRTLLPSGPRELEKGQVPMQVQSDPDSRMEKKACRPLCGPEPSLARPGWDHEQGWRHRQMKKDIRCSRRTDCTAERTFVQRLMPAGELECILWP